MLLRKKVYSFMVSLNKSYNTVILSCMNSDTLYNSRLWHHWRHMIFIYNFR